MIIVANVGRLQLSNFTIYIDDNNTEIINKPRDPLKSGQITVIQTGWTEDFTKILVQSSKANVTYSKSDWKAMVVVYSKKFR